MYDFDLATDYELGMEAWEDEQEILRQVQRHGLSLLTPNGFVAGHFVGTMKDNKTMAFRKTNGRVVAAVEFCGIRYIIDKANKNEIQWGEYPDGFPEHKKGDAVVPCPKEKPVTKLSNFVDHPSRTDCGSCLYVVRTLNKKYGYDTVYAGHNRKIAAKKIKEIKAAGKYPTVEVYDITRQDEYDALPF